MGPLCPCPNSKKTYEKGTRSISWGPLLTPGSWAVPEFPNGQSAPVACSCLLQPTILVHTPGIYMGLWWFALF
ncbi:unnamed protein product [Staurois parvus]|uniref:Uncharacterized protein n=1 Tax=Staurois parvus TaxID=386267 RepID=A0ABN9FXT9_9NEOB|nr:unnamed protein product [Staurois parvus]